MKRGLTWLACAASLAGAGAWAAEPALTAAERTRARALPHYATAGFELETGEVVYGAVVIAAFDDGSARVEFRGSGGPTSGAAVAGSFDLTAAAVEAGGLDVEKVVGVPAGNSYHSRGTLSDGDGRAAAIVESSLRVDQDGLFALEVVGADPMARRVRAFGRLVGACWTTRNDSVRRVADLSRRPDCLRLFGGL